MRGKFTLMLAVATLGRGLCRAEPPAALRVTDVRFWSFDDLTRVAIEVNGEFRHRSDRLENPDRLFFDLLGARPWFGREGIHTIEVHDRLLKRIRIAANSHSVTRIVLDLAAPADFTSSQLANPDRLMVELRAVGQVVPNPFSFPSIFGGERASPPVIPPPSLKLEPVKRELALPILSEATPPPELPKPPPLGLIAQPARRASNGESSMVRALGLKITRVVIDPGHGGYDTGSVGPSGLAEKDLVLDVAKRLGKLIRERMGSEVIYTRSDDTFVPLEARTELANEKQADLFLSIHANSSSYRMVSGVETYYLNFTKARDALDLASRENSASQKSIHELRDILQKITLNDKSEESREFASKVQAALFSFASRYNPNLRDRGIKKAPFVVLIGASMPSILAEIGFITNPREEALLKRAEHRQRLAEALYRGVSRYADSLSHFQVARKKG